MIVMPVWAQNESLTKKREVLHEKLSESDSQSRAGILLELGKTYLQDSIGTAQKYFEQALLNGNNQIKPEIYLNLSQIFVQKHNLDSMKYVLDKGIALAKKQNNQAVLPQLLYRKGDAFYYDNKYDLADNYYQKAITVAKKSGNYKLVADILVDRSYIYDFWAKRNEAMQMLSRAVKISDSIDYIKGEARASLLIGNIYHGLNNENKALEYYQRTLEGAKKINNIKGMAVATGNIGMSYLELGQLDLAIRFLKESIPYLKQIGDVAVLSNNYEDLGLVYSKKGDFKKTLFYADKGIAIIKQTGSKEDLSKALNAKAEALSNLGRYQMSNQYLDTCISIAKQTGFGLMLQKSYEKYADNLSKLGRHNLAYKYLKKHNSVKDSILTDKFQKRLADFESKYQTLQKQRRIENLEHAQKVQKMHFRLLGLGASGFIAFLLIMAWIVYQKRKKEREINRLELEKSQILAQNLSDQLELKNKQLTGHALNMMQKNKLLSAFSQNLSDILTMVTGEATAKIVRLKREVNKLLTSEKDWDTFKIYFEQVNKDFLSKLKEINKNLTTNDVRLATLIKLNMSNKEIASILNINHQSVKNAQYRLKSKLNLESGVDLRHFIADL